jgi:1,4-alpha-glucan branching enzyme
VLSYLRIAGWRQLVVVLNFTPEPRRGYRIGVPAAGQYRVLLNSDSAHYGGANVGGPVVPAEVVPAHGLPASLVLDLPPLAGLILVRAAS